jgi:hypothetical protein
MLTLKIMAGRAIGACQSTVPMLQSRLADQQTRLKEAVERFDGSEVRDTQLQRTTAWYSYRQVQLDMAEKEYGTPKQLAMAKVAYRAFFSEEWVPYDPNAKPNPADVKNTESLAAAKRALGINS